MLPGLMQPTPLLVSSILRYADVRLTGAGGFTILWSFSTCAAAEALAAAVSRLQW